MRAGLRVVYQEHEWTITKISVFPTRDNYGRRTEDATYYLKSDEGEMVFVKNPVGGQIRLAGS